MFLRSTTRAGLFAGALFLAAQPASARAAAVEWLLGPLTLAAGQSAEVLIGDPNISCSCGVQILAGKVAERGGGAFPLELVLNTYGDPDLIPGDRDLVQAKVRLTCSATTAQIRPDRPPGRPRTAAAMPGSYMAAGVGIAVQRLDHLLVGEDRLGRVDRAAGRRGRSRRQGRADHGAAGAAGRGAQAMVGAPARPLTSQPLVEP